MAKVVPEFFDKTKMGISENRGREVSRLYQKIQTSMDNIRKLNELSKKNLEKLQELQIAYNDAKNDPEKVEETKKALLDEGIPLSKELRGFATSITEEARKIDLANTGIKTASFLVTGDIQLADGTTSVSDIVEKSQKARTESQKYSSESREQAGIATGIIASVRKDILVQSISSVASATKEQLRMVKDIASKNKDAVVRGISSAATATTNAYKSLVPLTDTKVLKETYAELGRFKNELERIRNIVKDPGFKGLDYLPDGTLGNTNDYIDFSTDDSGASDDLKLKRREKLYEYFSKKFPFTYLQYTEDDPIINNYKPSDDVVIKELVAKSKSYLPKETGIKVITDAIQDEIDKTNIEFKKENDVKNAAEAEAIKQMNGGGQRDELLSVLQKRIEAIDILMSKIKEKVTPDKKTRPAQNGPEKAAEGISDPEFKVISRVFPAPFVNSKGFRIGNYHVIVNTDKLPFGSTDEADHFLYNLFDYINYEGTPKTSRKMVRKIKDFFKNKQVNLTAFLPIKYPDPFQEEFLRQQQVILMEENKQLRKNLRKLRNGLAEFSYSKDDMDLNKKILSKVDEDVGIQQLPGPLTLEDKTKKSKILAAYADAIDEEEGLLEGEAPEYKPALLEQRKKGLPVAGGSKKKSVQRKNRRTKRRKQGK